MSHKIWQTHQATDNAYHTLSFGSVGFCGGNVTLIYYIVVVVIHRGIGGEIGQDGDFMIFEGSRYRGGFMYKTLAMSAIVSLSALY